MQDQREIIELINRFRKFIIITHEDPDGDALGSVLAMRLALGQLGKEGIAFCADEVPAVFLFLPGAQDFQKDFLVADYEAMIAVDGGDLRHTGIATRVRTLKKTKKPLVVIDHHPKSDLSKLADLKIVDTTAASTTQILYRLLSLLGVSLNKDIATCLLTGLYTDTGGFQHSNTGSDIYRIAADLMLRGARLNKIARSITLNRSVQTLKLWGVALQRLTKNSNLGIISSFITQQDLIENNATEADIAGVVNLINSVPQTQMAVLFSETSDGMVRASLRTESGGVDVSRLAKYFGGGGHKKASGFKIPGRIVNRAGQWQVMTR